MATHSATIQSLKGKELWLVKKPENISSADLTRHVGSLKKRNVPMQGGALRLRRLLASKSDSSRISVGLLEDNAHHLGPGLTLAGTVIISHCPPTATPGSSSSAAGDTPTPKESSGDDTADDVPELPRKLTLGPPPVTVELRQRFVPFGCSVRGSTEVNTGARPGGERKRSERSDCDGVNEVNPGAPGGERKHSERSDGGGIITKLDPGNRDAELVTSPRRESLRKRQKRNSSSGGD